MLEYCLFILKFPWAPKGKRAKGGMGGSHFHAKGGGGLVLEGGGDGRTREGGGAQEPLRPFLFSFFGNFILYSLFIIACIYSYCFNFLIFFIIFIYCYYSFLSFFLSYFLFR